MEMKMYRHDDAAKIVLVFALLLLAPALLFCGEEPLVVNLAYTNNTFGIPFLNSPIGYSLNPGLKASAEFAYTGNDVFNAMENVFVSYSYHDKSLFGSVISIGTDCIGRVDLDFGLYFDGIIGFSYTHAFSGIPTYYAGPTSVEKSIDWGRPGIGAGLGMRMGYRFDVTGHPLRIYLGSDFDLAYNFTNSLWALAPSMTLTGGVSFSVGGGL